MGYESIIGKICGRDRQVSSMEWKSKRLMDKPSECGYCGDDEGDELVHEK